MHLQEPVFNGSQSTYHFLFSRSTPRLLHGLPVMSLAKAVPKGIRDKECKRFALCKSPPVSYVPEKDPIQEMVSALKSNQSLKTTIGDDTELRVFIWHAGTHKAFLIHVAQPSMQLRNGAPSRPMQKPVHPMWSIAKRQSKQRPLWLF
jgi:hypothetical protein